MYKYKLKLESDDKALKFQDIRIKAFDSLEDRLEELKKLLRQGKNKTIRYYRENPESFNVVVGTDLIKDYFNDIETLLKTEE
jgi:hypothetical protein